MSDLPSPPSFLVTSFFFTDSLRPLYLSPCEPSGRESGSKERSKSDDEEVEFVSADADKELIRLMATLGLPTTFGTSLEVKPVKNRSKAKAATSRVVGSRCDSQASQAEGFRETMDAGHQIIKSGTQSNLKSSVARTIVSTERMLDQDFERTCISAQDIGFMESTKVDLSVPIETRTKIRLSQRTHIRFADSDDDFENRGVALFSSVENTESKVALNDVNNDIFPADYPQLVFEAKNEKVYESVDGENMITTYEKRKRRRNTSRMLEKMPTEIWSGLAENFNSGSLEGMSERTAKYWYQRYRLFSRYDEGIKMDEEGWFSVTPECIAQHQASRMFSGGLIVDAFVGVGGNAIQFALRGDHVIAIDIDPLKIEYARHNAAIYGVVDHIEFIVGDFFKIAPNLKADAIFLSPPWGGPSYSGVEKFDLHTMIQPLDGFKLFQVAQAVAPNVVFFLPRNVDLDQLAELSWLANPPLPCEVERNFIHEKLKAITVYYGDVACTKASASQFAASHEATI